MTIKEALDPGISSGKYYVTGLAGSVNVVVAGPFGDQEMADKVAKLCPLWRAVKGSAIGAFVEAKDDSAVATSTVWANLSEPVLRYTCLDHANAAAAALSGVQKRKVLTNGAQFVVVVEKDAKDLKKVGYDDVTAEPEAVDIARIAEAIDRQLDEAAAPAPAGGSGVQKITYTDRMGNKDTIAYFPQRATGKLQAIGVDSRMPQSTANYMFMRNDLNGTAAKAKAFDDALNAAGPNGAEAMLKAAKEVTKLPGSWSAYVPLNKEAAGEKLVSTFENGDRVAKVYKDTEWDTEWDTHRVKFFVGGKHQTEADSEDDKQGCIDTAKSWVKQAKEAGNIANLAPKFAKKGGKDDKDKDGKSDKDEKDKAKGKKPWEETTVEEDLAALLGESGPVSFPTDRWGEVAVGARVDFKVGHKRYFAKLEPDLESPDPENTFGITIELVTMSPAGGKPEQTEHVDYLGEIDGRDAGYLNGLLADMLKAKGLNVVAAESERLPNHHLALGDDANMVADADAAFKKLNTTPEQKAEWAKLMAAGDEEAIWNKIKALDPKFESLREARLDRAQIDSLWAKFEECDKVTQEAGDGVTIGQRQKRSRAFNEFKRACAYMNLDPAKEAVEYMKKGSLAKIAEDGELDADMMEDPAGSVDADIEGELAEDAGTPGHFPGDKVKVGSEIFFSFAGEEFSAKLEPDLDSPDPENTFVVDIYSQNVGMTPVDSMSGIDGEFGEVDAAHLNEILDQMYSDQGITPEEDLPGDRHQEDPLDEANSMGLIDAAKDHLGVDFAMKTSYEGDVKVTSITPKASPQQGAVEAFAQAVQALGLDAEYDGDTGSFRVTQAVQGEAVTEEAVFESKKY